MVQVEFRVLTAANVDAFNELHLSPDQYHAMAYPPMATWYGFFQDPELHFNRIFWDVTLDKPIGMVQISLNTDGPGEHFIERFLIDKRYQGQGYGRACLNLIFQAVREELPGLRKGIKLSYEAPLATTSCPEEFYLKVGFRHLGTVDDGFVEMYYAFDEKNHKSAAGTVAPVGRSNEEFVLIPELKYFKFSELEEGMQAFPVDIEAADLELRDYNRYTLWFNWAVHQPSESILFKLLFSAMDLARYAEAQAEGRQANFSRAVGYAILQKEDPSKSEHVLKHVFVNPNVRGRGLAKKALNMFRLNMVITAVNVKRTRGSMGLVHLDEVDGHEEEDVSPLLTKLGFVVNGDKDFVRIAVGL
ncbi:UNVERIFIED_CONTAM: hypothetical protein HDU68_003494 [Siphonaria sp. JEL0065]|nr:hypothetical protein HDU68_003494 [Siphonaria sp. JEL0065]